MFAVKYSRMRARWSDVKYILTMGLKLVSRSNVFAVKYSLRLDQL